MALFLSVELGDTVKIGSSTIAFEKKSGRMVRLKINSAEDVEHVKSGEEPAKEPLRLTRAALRSA